MRIIESISEVKAIIRAQRKIGKTIGFVPTMGYLHEGHKSLIKASVSENDFNIVSIFVNPIQFGVNEDFSKYPRDMSSDSKLAQEEGVDIIFAPTINEMYPNGFKTYVEVGEITNIMCGKSRPGHFKGVTTVVNKLFNIVSPDKAYFGQKDAQQVAVIKQMVSDLNMNIEIITCPIIREADGLAMSSRNVYLSPEERKAATILSKALFEAVRVISDGERRKEKVLEFITSRILSEKSAQIDYISIVSADTLEEIKIVNGKLLIALAVKFGTTRLIDNIIVEV